MFTLICFAAAYLAFRLRREILDHATAAGNLERLQVRFRGVYDAEAERQRVLEQIQDEQAAAQRSIAPVTRAEAVPSMVDENVSSLGTAGSNRLPGRGKEFLGLTMMIGNA